MPFTFRDKPKLADRLRGKTGEEILNELKSDFDPEARMSFDSPSMRSRQNSGFPRGFPFDGGRNRSNIRSYLDDIACRYPEFADQLREPPWDEDFVNDSLKKKQRGSNLEREENKRSEASGSSQSKVEEPRQNLTNFGLRNTVPLGPEAVPREKSKQRSMSAPPDHRAADSAKRFVTKCEIPIMTEPKQNITSEMPDLAEKGTQEQNQPKLNNTPTVRVIPIQVEGRDTPIVNTNIDTASNFGSETFRDSTFEGRLPRDFGVYQRHSPRFAHKERSATPPQYQYAPQYQQYAPPQQQYTPPQQQYAPPHQPQFMHQPQYAHPPYQQSFSHQPQHPQKPPAPPPQQHPPQQQRSQTPVHPQSDETDSKPPPPPTHVKPEQPKDPMEKVQLIQKEVEELMKQVDGFNGHSRTDKQYLMLDELLTRQLLLLDGIDAEGKENVRQARKDTIRIIQNCISTLENKVPLAENNETAMVVFVKEGETGQSQSMEVDEIKENTAVESKESQEMEVDNKEKKESQPPQEQQQDQPQVSQQKLQEENEKKV